MYEPVLINTVLLKPMKTSCRVVFLVAFFTILKQKKKRKIFSLQKLVSCDLEKASKK